MAAATRMSPEKEGAYAVPHGVLASPTARNADDVGWAGLFWGRVWCGRLCWHSSQFATRGPANCHSSSSLTSRSA